jgi:endogenous inhibitor of DNA gyrase (YacG/DUF329 family)
MADLGRWLSEDYRVPGRAPEDSDRVPPGDTAGGTRPDED